MTVTPAEAPGTMRREYPDRPLVGVGVVVWRGQQVLLIRRGRPPRQGQWSLPGGAQELGETVAQTAAREVREETGVEIAETLLVDVVDSIQTDDDGRVRYHYTLVDVTAEWQGGEPVAGSDAMAAAWVDRDALAPLALWPETTRIITRAAELLGKPEPAGTAPMPADR